MNPLNARQIAEYFHRSYTAVDGLWFMKLEERIGFDAALDVDVAVWEIMPKIQARALKELAGCENGLEALRECLSTKLVVEGYQFTIVEQDGGQALEVTLTECPWLNKMVKSNRQHLAGTIGERICSAEFAVWAREFGEDIEFSFGGRLCQDCANCTLRFSHKAG